MHHQDRITPDEVENLSQLFQERATRSPNNIAYQYFNQETNNWEAYTWRDMSEQIGRWQNSLQQHKLLPGDRVAIMMKNSPQWVMCEQAILGLGLVVVPLYINDRCDNARYIINDAGVKILFIDGTLQYKILEEELDSMPSLKKIVSLQGNIDQSHPLLQTYKDWFIDEPSDAIATALERHSLSSIVYTSGTTGKPKGVMLSHRNILWNAYSSSECYPFLTTDSYLSFLPLSHMFERTVGYYLPMITGGTVIYARSIDLLGEDLQTRKPTILVTVPRIFERVYNKINEQLKLKSPLARKLFNLTIETGWRRFLYLQKKGKWSLSLFLWPVFYLLVARKIKRKLGGKLRVAISGGAPLSFDIARVFTGLGLTISQGYGLTEAAPVICTNRVFDNEVASVGQALPDVEVRLGPENELQIRSPGVMLGYWHNQVATQEMIDADGWLHTGDKAEIKGEHIYITGRIKEIIVLSNGEKIPPSDIELAITTDILFEQAIIVGESKPFLSAIVTVNREQYTQLCRSLNLPQDTDLHHPRVTEVFLQHIRKSLAGFPGYAKIYRVHAELEPWTVEEGLITPTLKIKRNLLHDRYADVIQNFYTGH